MSTISSSAASAKRHAGNVADHAQREVAPWVEKLARFGYAAKGFTYVLIGLLALQAALTDGGDVGGSKNALSSLQGEGMLGTVLLWLVAIGMTGYAIWQFFRAVLDPEDEGDDGKGIAKRVFFAISGIIHGALAIWIYTHLLTAGGGSDGDGGGGGTEGLVQRALDWGTAGRLLVGAVGIGIGIFGIHQLIKAWKVDLSDQLALARMSEPTRKATIITGRLGLGARGIIFSLVGFFVLTAAWQYDSSESSGVGETLQWIGDFGPWILGIMAVGLIAYGLFMFIKARFRRINVTT